MKWFGYSTDDMLAIAQFAGEGRGDSLLAIFATCYMRYKYSE